MTRSDIDKYIDLTIKRSKIDQQMEILAWRIAPDRIKELLCGKHGPYQGFEGLASNWLIRPNRWLYNSPLVIIIMGGEAGIKQVVSVINQIIKD